MGCRRSHMLPHTMHLRRNATGRGGGQGKNKKNTTGCSVFRRFVEARRGVLSLLGRLHFVESAFTCLRRGMMQRLCSLPLSVHLYRVERSTDSGRGRRGGPPLVHTVPDRRRPRTQPPRNYNHSVTRGASCTACGNSNEFVSLSRSLILTKRTSVRRGHPSHFTQALGNSPRRLQRRHGHGRQLLLVPPQVAPG